MAYALPRPSEGLITIEVEAFGPGEVEPGELEHPNGEDGGDQAQSVPPAIRLRHSARPNAIAFMHTSPFLIVHRAAILDPSGVP